MSKAKTKKTKPKAKTTRVEVRYIDRVVGLAADYETPHSVQLAIDSYRFTNGAYPVHRIIEYVRRLEDLLRGKPRPGVLVLRSYDDPAVCSPWPGCFL